MFTSGKHQMVAVKDIELDTTNPRIAHFVEMYGGKVTDDQIFMALNVAGDDEGQGPTFNKLRQAIATCGGIISPVLLNRQSDGKLLCIEGNTRVALYRDFLQIGQEGNWEFIPAIVYEGLDPAQVDAIRLQAHLVGPRAWDPYSKAKYLHELRTKEHIPFSQLVDFCGGSEKTVQESLGAYRDMEKHYRPLLAADEDFDVRRFSGFVELQKPGIKEAIQKAGFSVTDFSNWIIEKKIEKLQDVRLLPRIFKDAKARESFLKAGASEAVRALERPDLGKAFSEASLADLCRAASLAVDKISFRDVQRMREDPGSPDSTALREGFEALQALVKELDLVGDES